MQIEWLDEEYSFTVPGQSAGTRIDVLLAEALELSRSQVQRLIGDGQVLVAGKRVKANYKVQGGERVEGTVPPPEELQVEPEAIPLDIVYEDGDVVVVNKPQGMVVHPAPGSAKGTLVNALLYHCRDLSGINGVIRPGIVHRIDKDTSGLVVAAKNDQAHLKLAAAIKAHRVTRKYWALVHGVMVEPGGTVDAPIGRDPKDRQKMAVVFDHSKEAVTHYEVLERFPGYTLVECTLETGRTHQIRVHMAYLKHPVVGDPKYGPRKCPFAYLEGQVLHAKELRFVHPRTGEEMAFEAPLPESFRRVLEDVRSEE